jgi:hypothetical protein
LIDFLKDYDAQKNPPVTDISTYGLFELTAQTLSASAGIDLTGGAEDWLTVRFVELPELPSIPEELSAYLPAATQISAREQPEVSVPAEDQEVGVGGDGSSPTATGARRSAGARDWVTREWAPWARKRREAEVAKEVYRRLFEQQQAIEASRETFELVWGFGVVQWTQPDRSHVNHPLFTAAVEILTGEDQQLSVRQVEPLQLETLPFASNELSDRVGLTRQREAIYQAPFDPWDAESLAFEVRRAVRALDHDGIIAGEGSATSSAPVADTDWVLFARRRRPDRQGFLDAMRELYADGVVPPEALSSVVVDAPSTYTVSGSRFAIYRC